MKGWEAPIITAHNVKHILHMYYPEDLWHFGKYGILTSDHCVKTMFLH
jgi:hypothetical protein